VEVCRADLSVWYDSQEEIDYNNAQVRRVTDGIPNPTAIAKLSVEEVKARVRELIECRRVDPSNEDEYFKTQGFYHDVQADRWLDFLLRHQLMKQFDREDAAGKR